MMAAESGLAGEHSYRATFGESAQRRLDARIGRRISMTRIPDTLRRLQSMPAVTPDTSRIQSHPLRRSTSSQDVMDAAQGRAAPPQAHPLAQAAWDAMSNSPADETAMPEARGELVYEEHYDRCLERLGDVHRGFFLPSELADVDFSVRDDRESCETFVCKFIDKRQPEDSATHLSLQKHLITLKCCRALVARLHQGQDAELLQSWRAENMPAADLPSRFRACLAAALTGDQVLSASFLENLPGGADQQIDDAADQDMRRALHQALCLAASQPDFTKLERVLNLPATVGMAVNARAIGQPAEGQPGPLHYAAMTGNAAAVRSLLERVEPDDIPVLVMQRDIEGENPLFMAANRPDVGDVDGNEHVDHLETLRALLKRVPQGRYAEVLGSWDPRGQTLLHALSANRDVAAIQEVLTAVPEHERPGVIRQMDFRNYPPLHRALIRDFDEVVQTILGQIPPGQYTYILGQRTPQGRTFMHLPVVNGNPAQMRTVLTAIPEDERARVMDRRDGDGDTPLHSAARRSDHDMLIVILDNIPQFERADLVGQRSLQVPGESLLHHAARNGHVGVIEAAHEKIADPDQRTDLAIRRNAALYHHSPLYLAANLRDGDATRALLDMIPEHRRLEASTQFNVSLWRPLFFAAGHGSVDVVRAFSERITDPLDRRILFRAGQGNDGLTPFHAVVSAGDGRIETAGVILGAIPANERWAAVRQPDVAGVTPISFAEQQGRQDLVNLFNLIPEPA